jgi:hypothetical protein
MGASRVAGERENGNHLFSVAHRHGRAYLWPSTKPTPLTRASMSPDVTAPMKIAATLAGIAAMYVVWKALVIEAPNRKAKFMGVAITIMATSIVFGMIWL